MGVVYIILALVIVGATVAAAIAARSVRRDVAEAQVEYDEAMASYEKAKTEYEGMSAQERRYAGPYSMPNRPNKPTILTKPAPKPWQAVVAGALALALVSAIFSFTIVGARTVGIQTALGTYVSTMGSGVNWTYPWAGVDRFSTRIQTVEMTLSKPENEDEDSKVAVPVAFEGGGKGWVNAIVRWQINPNTDTTGAKALWEKYKDFETVQQTLVYAESRDATLNVANDYQPQEAISSQDKMGEEIKARLASRLATYGVLVDSVSVLSVPLNEKTQQSLDRIVASEANITNAQKEKTRATIDAETAEIRAKSGLLDAGGLTRYCLEMANAWDVAKNGPLPAGFNCMTATVPVQTLNLNK